MERYKKIAAEKEEEAKEAVEKKEEAEADVLKQLDSSQALLEKLLKEQREGLSSELKNTKKELAAEQESKHKMDYELQRLREDKDAKEKASQVEIWRLKAEIQKLTAPPPKPKVRPNALTCALRSSLT